MRVTLHIMRCWCLNIKNNFASRQKDGYFINLDGINAGNDFWILSDANKLAKIAEIENTWIAYVVYKLKK